VVHIGTVLKVVMGFKKSHGFVVTVKFDYFLE